MNIPDLQLVSQRAGRSAAVGDYVRNQSAAQSGHAIHAAWARPKADALAARKRNSKLTRRRRCAVRLRGVLAGPNTTVRGIPMEWPRTVSSLFLGNHSCGSRLSFGVSAFGVAVFRNDGPTLRMVLPTSLFGFTL